MAIDMAEEVFTFVGLSTATGIVLGPGIRKMTMEGYVVAAVGDRVAPHPAPNGNDYHENATLITPIPKYSIGGLQPALSGVPASCGCIIRTPLKYG